MDRIELNAKAKTTGNICEAVALAKLLKKGWSVSIPYGDNCRYDFILDKKDGNLYKIQVKSASRPKEKNNQVLTFFLETRNSKGFNKYTKDDVDAFIAVDLVEDRVFYVPFEKTKDQRTFQLRLIESSYNIKDVNWAKDFEIL